MSPQWLIFVTLFHFSWGGEFNDVTTVYDIGNAKEYYGSSFGDLSNSTLTNLDVTGRAHMRTKSLGLPLYEMGNMNAPISDSRNSPINISCLFGDIKCDWIQRNWTKLEEDIVPGKAYPVNPYTKIKLNSEPYTYDYSHLYFTSDPLNLDDTNLKFIILFYPQIYTYPQMVKRFTTGHYVDDSYNLLDRNGNTVQMFCYSQCSKTELSGFSGYPAEIWFEFEKNRFNIVWSGKTRFAVQSSGSLYFSTSIIHSGDFNAKLTREKMSLGAELESPVFELMQQNRFWLSLMVETSDVHQDTLFRVTLKDVTQNELISSEDISGFKAGFNIKHIEFEIEKKLSGRYKLVITSTTSHKINISHITTRNKYDEDIYLLPSSITEQSNLRNLPIYIARNSLISSQPEKVENNAKGNSSISCLNGGVSTEWGCNCPPGFTGDRCQRGCGRNRFGQDCGGRCSYRLAECQGLLLCNDAVLCRCAPGYRGERCKEVCSYGVYGNDCLQPCGQCAHGAPCDIYTGECAACEPGYRLPHCQLPNVYYPMKPELSSPNYGVIRVGFDPTQYTSGDQPPQLYQIQFRNKRGSWKIFKTRSVMDTEMANKNKTEEFIDNLDSGTIYEVRVLFLDADFNKYDGNLVKHEEILTKCDIPEAYDYNVQYSSSNSSFTFTWTYSNTTEHWCPVEYYEVSWEENYQWRSDNTRINNYTLQQFISGIDITFDVRAKTIAGFAPFSKTIKASTRPSGTLGVTNIHTTISGGGSIRLTWEPPSYSGDRNITYNIIYKCVDQPACSPGCANATEGSLSQEAETFATLSQLLPFARYRVSITPEGGPTTTTYVGTSKTLPTEKPLLSGSKSVERTNTSLTVFWDPVPVCSGFLTGYHYQIVKESEPLKVLTGGFTRDTSVSFRNLSASTEYEVKVFIVNEAGWNPDTYLKIAASTSATVPEAVQELTVYKRGRNSLGLRWGAPKALYGRLKSFTVSHAAAAGPPGVGERSRVVEPTPCQAWPHLYCHTVEGLVANRHYTLSVSARNSEVSENGVWTSVTAVTKEASPSAPVALRLSNSSESSVGLVWEHPDLANGQLRSFVISVEETERFDQDGCCQVYPLMETPVTDERHTYEAEVSGLQPAATYYVSVSAKTVGLGTAQSLVIHTRPPHLPITVESLPTIDGVLLEYELSWITKTLPLHNKSFDIYQPLVKARLLLAVVNETTENGTGISEPQLESLLLQILGRPFVFVSEYNQGDSASDLVYNDFPPSFDLRSQPPTLLLPGDSHFECLVAAQITEYGGVYNADLVLSTPVVSTQD